jgi:hypothetical protein
VNFNFTITIPGLLPILTQLKDTIMTIKDDFAASQAAQAAHFAALEASNDAALLSFSAIVDALRAAQAGGTGLSAADVTAAITANTALIARIDAAKAKDDAAAAIVP